jgi:hypothetical protein
MRKATDEEIVSGFMPNPNGLFMNEIRPKNRLKSALESDI